MPRPAIPRAALVRAHDRWVRGGLIVRPQEWRLDRPQVDPPAEYRAWLIERMRLAYLRSQLKVGGTISELAARQPHRK